MQGSASRILALGDRIAVDCGWFWHVGNVSGFAFDGQPFVVSASKRRRMVLEETLAEFSAGRPIRHDGYRSHLPRHVVVARLRSMIGQPWHLLRNCEHVAALAEGNPPSSPQLAGWGVAGLLLFALTKASA